MKTYKFIFFDADDTLFDFKKSESHAFKKLLSEFDLEFNFENYIESYRNISDKLWLDLEKNIITLNELKLLRFELFANKISLDVDSETLSKMYLNFLGECTFLIPGAIDILQYLKKKYTIVIITNGISVVQKKRLENSKIKGYIDGMVVSEELKISKPNPEIFKYALKKFNCHDKSSALMIGDSLTSDILGGINSGIDTCWLNSNNSINYTNHIPTYEINTLIELKKLL
ncbi:YjjG family noncanonical pyrimidine nucleotidase [Clostridioides difficile]|nr:YjjG family noncanonical pyrimidine nucleotidase [Clostridioides difficile]MCW0823750.1 YjjG family noncanonical pyrimidine nucleotidase [Clostridioides difficile]